VWCICLLASFHRRGWRPLLPVSRHSWTQFSFTVFDIICLFATLCSVLTDRRDCLRTECVTNVTIVGATNGSTIYADTAVTCVADNKPYPLPSFTWTNDVDGSHLIGPVFVLQADQQYKLTCNASNNVDRCFATEYVEFNSKLLSHSLYFPFSDHWHAAFFSHISYSLIYPTDWKPCGQY